MGEHFAIELADETARLVEDLLKEGTLRESLAKVSCREMVRIKKEDGLVEDVGISNHRAGFALELDQVEKE